MPTASCYLVGDIGGTNIRLAMVGGDPRDFQCDTNYAKHPATGSPWDVLDALRDYRKQHHDSLAAACFGIAGRIRDDGEWVKMTNRDIKIRREEIASILGIAPHTVKLVNDMPPHIACVDALHDDELLTIKPGKEDRGGTRAIVMPGSGLGVGGSTWNGKQYLPFPSEGGHLHFAPKDDEQIELFRTAMILARAEGFENLTNEYLISGPGIRRLHACLLGPGDPHLDAMPKSEQISKTALSDPSSPEARTMRLFVKILGQVCGNVALITLSTGGLYLGGSIGHGLLPLLQSPTFLDAFLHCGPPAHRSLLDEIPIRMIRHDQSGLLGAAVLAQAME